MSSDWRVKQFEYPSVMAGITDDRSGAERHVWPLEEEAAGRSNNEEQSLREAQAREIGRHEGETKARVQYEENLRKEREGLAEAIRQFQAERSRYFEQVESEVVQLALAVARRVIRRESQVDPDLLTGLVRYTLEKLRDGTSVKLRVNPSQVSHWRMQFEDEIELRADNEVDRDSCVIETNLGTTAVNVDSQLKEIENGLMDLLAQRPVLQ